MYNLYELIPTAMNVNDEKNIRINKVIFETSTSPNWIDIKNWLEIIWVRPLKKIFKFLNKL